MQIEGIIAKGQLITCTFMQSDVAASQTDVQLPVAEVRDTAAGADDQNAVNEYSQAFAGAIVGIAYDLSAAATAGQLTIGVTVNGTEDTDTTQTVTTGQRGTARFPREQNRYVRGDRIGVEITTNAGWDATTADLLVVVSLLAEVTDI